MYAIHLCSLAIVSAVMFSSEGHAATKSQRWVDLNFVPCEGIGATGTGQVEATVTYEIDSSVVKVVSLKLDLRYGAHNFEPSAALQYKQPDGQTARLVMQEAWFATIRASGDGGKTLYLPRSGSAPGIAAQTPFKMATGTNVSIDVSIRFPQDGGNCFASFSEKLSLP